MLKSMVWMFLSGHSLYYTYGRDNMILDILSYGIASLVLIYLMAFFSFKKYETAFGNPLHYSLYKGGYALVYMSGVAFWYKTMINYLGDSSPLSENSLPFIVVVLVMATIVTTRLLHNIDNGGYRGSRLYAEMISEQTTAEKYFTIFCCYVENAALCVISTYIVVVLKLIYNMLT